MQWVLKLLGIDPLGKLIDGLNDAYKARLNAKNDSERIAADVTIAGYEASIERLKTQADVVKTGMQHKAFWIPWLMATIPLSAWFGWGMLDTLANGALPDVAAIPPGLLPWAETAWQNVFFAGGGVAGLSAVASALKGRK